MPYNRDEVVASVTEFYQLLTTQLHFYPSELKTPPPAGWPQITPPSTDRQRKSDTAIDLLRHLPYLPGGNAQDKWIYDQTICADYTDRTVEQGVEMDLAEVVDNCPWEKLKDPSRAEHIVALGVPEILSPFCVQDWCFRSLLSQVLTRHFLDTGRRRTLHLPGHTRWRGRLVEYRSNRLLELRKCRRVIRLVEGGV